VTYRHDLRIRYYECDMQQIVHNSLYAAFVDDALDTWLRAALGSFEDIGFDVMLKKLTLEWQSPATAGEVLTLDCSIARWGTTSFEVHVVGHVGERPVFTAEAIEVSVTPGAPKPVPIPAFVREALAGAVA
jgi:acyl-CoA thioester hydrolase